RKLILRYIIEEDTIKAETYLKNEYLYENVKILNTADMNAALTDSNVHICIICTPTYTHESLVKSSINHGKHTFCEKPLAETYEKIRECYDLAAKLGVRIFCAF
uniref:Gfo/Idh/MocA family oxidoreductase n=1 Tax=Salmonella sp. s54836 TaxID=3159673 RepID=UPI00397EA4A0